MLAVILLHVCLTTALPDDESECRDVYPLDQVTWFECQGATGQEVAQKWLDEHPKWRLARIGCRVQTSGPEKDI